MALSPAQSAYLADLLTGIGSGFMSAPRNGPPLAGFSMGLQNANQLMGMRRQQADQDQERAFRATQMQRQIDADAEQKRKESAAKSWLIGRQAPATDSASARGANPSTGAISQLPAGHQSFYQGFANIDPMAAAQMAGQEMLKDPAKPEPPVVKDFYEGGSVVQKQWDPSTGQWTEVGKGARWQPVQPPQLPADVQEYLFAKQQDPTIGTYAAWKKSQGGESMRYGLNPVYGTKGGKTVILLPNSSGGVVEAPLPDGVTIAPQTQIFDTGTAGVPIDKRTGLPIPNAEPIAKDNAGKTSQTTQGEAQGKVAAGLPDTLAGADLALKTIEDLKSDPARTAATGMSSLVMDRIPGTPAYDYTQKVNQAKGQVFRQVYESLRGGGAITEIEGGKAEQALARLDTAQTEDGFLQALNELETIIKSGADRAKQKAAAGPQIMAPDAAPSAIVGPTVPPPPPGFEIVK